MAFSKAGTQSNYDGLDLYYSKNNTVVKNLVIIDRFFLLGEHYINVGVPTIELASFTRFYIKKSS